MRIGFVQNQPAFGEVAKNLARVEELWGDKTADLIVLPELFATGYQFASAAEANRLSEQIPGGPTTDRLIALAKSRNAVIVAGLSERDGNTLYNSAVIVGPGGYMGKYRKAHVFGGENDFFKPGNLPFEVYNVGEARVGIMICFDWRFPEAARTLALKGADIIAHPSNLVLPHCPQAMITRCLENRVYAVTADRVGGENRVPGQSVNFIGQSQIVDPDGNVLFRASPDREETHVITIDIAKARDKKITPENDLFADRRTDLYELD